MVMIDYIDNYVAQYNAKDAIIYAISIGLGSTSDKYNRDLRFVYEDHEKFMVFPTFALTLMFSAAATKDGSTYINCSSVSPFPPPLMKAMGVIPLECLQENINLNEYPVIHTSQSVSWIRDMPIPRDSNNISIQIKGKFLSVIPKAVGTFVTSEYELYEIVCNGTHPLLICSIQSTALVLGIPEEAVHAFQCPSASFQARGDSIFLRRKKTLLFEADWTISPNTALLYRLASGDTNNIHVDPQAVQMFANSVENGPSNNPLLHGLCTLSIAVRIIVQFLDTLPRYGNFSVQYLCGNFVKPVFVNDVILVQAYECDCAHSEEGLAVSFTVQRKNSGQVLLDKGRLQLQELVKPKSFDKIRSNL